jgi:acetyl esterase/lipase
MADFLPTRRILELGCALVCINYRFIKDGKRAGLFPPVLAPLRDAARALQYVRYHAHEWNLDAQRVIVHGGSAGACSALWLGMSKDLAEPDSDDPVARQSTAVLAIGGQGAQTSLDPIQMRRWVGEGLTYGGHAFGAANFDEFLARRGEFETYFPQVSPASMIHRNVPPIYLKYDKALKVEKPDHEYYTHSPHFGLGLAEAARSCSATCYVSYAGEEKANPASDVIGSLCAILTAGEVK